MHILMTVNAAWNIWKFRRSVADALIADGHKITILAPPDKSVADLKALGCRFIPLTMNVKGLNPLSDLMLVLRFQKLFKEEQPDLILSYTIKNNIFGALAARRNRIPLVPNVSGLGTAFLSGGIIQQVAEMLYRHAFSPLPQIFFQNDDDQSFFVSRKLVQKHQTQLLPGSGIDLDHFSATKLPEKSESPVFLLIARLLRDKGVIEYVEAARLVKSIYPNARFQLLGDVGSKNRTAIDADTVKKWQMEGAIEYLGTTSDVRPFIAASTCVVLPSYREGAPRTLIEAAAMARPLIATDVPGCRSVIDDGKTGFLCEVRNAQSLADACQRFLEMSPENRQHMGLAGRTKMERQFDQSFVIEAYRKVVRELTVAKE